jgi:hypothetical protein
MSFEVQHTPADLARKALAELSAAEMDTAPVELMGGTLKWEESWTSQVEAARDPINAPTMRPQVVAACQELQKHPAVRLHCTCRRGLDFLALASLATGVLVISSPRRLPKKRRQGGPNDLASVDPTDPPEAGWSLMKWEASLFERAARHHTAWESTSEHPVLGPNTRVIGDAAKRQTFECPGCGATHTYHNVTLLRMVLEAIAAGESTVRLRKTAT